MSTELEYNFADSLNRYAKRHHMLSKSFQKIKASVGQWASGQIPSKSLHQKLQTVQKIVKQQQSLSIHMCEGLRHVSFYPEDPVLTEKRVSELEVPTYRAYIQYIMREGHGDVGERIIDALQVERPPYSTELGDLIRNNRHAAEQGNYEPAFTWVRNQMGPLFQFPKGVELAWIIHLLHFRNIIQERGTVAGFMFARQYFYDFLEKKEKEVRQALLVLVFQSFDHNATKSLLDGNTIDNMLELLDIATHRIHALARHPVILSVTSTGYGQLSAYLADTETPRIAPIVPYHTTFICPVLRAFSMPAVVLSCGHMMSEEAVAGFREKKCPFCHQSYSKVVTLQL